MAGGPIDQQNCLDGTGWELGELPRVLDSLIQSMFSLGLDLRACQENETDQQTTDKLSVIIERLWSLANEARTTIASGSRPEEHLSA